MLNPKLPGLKTYLASLLYAAISTAAGVTLGDQGAPTSFDPSAVDWSGVLLAAMIAALRAGVQKIQDAIKL